MDWMILCDALGLMLIIMGIMPFLNPEQWRRYLLTLAKQNDGMIRRIGLIGMIMGLLIIYLVRFFNLT